MNKPSLRYLIATAALCGGALLNGCNRGSSKQDAFLPGFLRARFSSSASITHSHFPLTPGVTSTYLVVADDSRESIVVEVMDHTRVVAGIHCRPVRDRVYCDGLLIEDTEDWYAQDDDGNVWYMGEAVTDFIYDDQGNLIETIHDGSWEAGLDVAKIGVIASPGYIMPASPRPGTFYLQEFYPGEAEDTGKILALDVPVTLADGSVHRCIEIEDGSQLAAGKERKYFAPGIGKVSERTVGADQSGELIGRFRPGTASLPAFGQATFTTPTHVSNPFFPSADTQVYFAEADDGDETIIVERLPGSRTVADVACAIVRDRVYRDGLLIEDTHDWYAQDDAGNAWYMGEEVDNHHYDESGNLLSTDHEGSWEAGRDTAQTGTVAAPGFAMPAGPLENEGFHQEYYPGEATDMALIVALNVAVELEDGREFTGCVQTLDWNPLDPDGLEHKFYAPDIGLVREDVLHADEVLEHVATFRQGSAPDFSAATFSNPTAITHSHFPLPVGATWEYEKDGDDGPEVVHVSIQCAPRTVLGIACIEGLYTKTVDGRTIEVARDWYAQDDAGNVWYMGEVVDNYHYDASGTLLEITHEGSWEAGLDIASVGHVAEPGFLMPATPTQSMSYYQEVYRTLAEDMAYVSATGLTLEVDGRTFTNVLRTCDWNPLEPDTLEYKFYAPGIGLVREQDVGSDEGFSDLVDSSLLPN